MVKKVCVMGLGYIGLPTASVLATNGFQVVGVDVSQHIIDTVNRGDIHIEEPGLHTIVQAAIQSGNLRAAAEPEPADVFLIAVPTPLSPDKQADMQFVRRATESLVPHLRRGNLIILESTSPPGTCRELIKPIIESGELLVGEDIYLAYCPERVLPGRILKELIENDRIIGGYDVLSAERAQDLYENFVDGKLFLTDSTTAETVKLLENTYRDVNIALANEAALLCEQLGVDFWEVARFANRHPRVNVHNAGPGVGGHCISVDPWFLVQTAPGLARIIRLARECNDEMPEHVVNMARELVSEIEAPKIVLLGLAYKGNVDDIRESPALRVAELLQDAGFDIHAADPHVRQAPVPLDDFDIAIEQADLLILLTDHDEYRALNPRRIAQSMRTPQLLDTRNIMSPDLWKEAGFKVRTLGKGEKKLG